MKKSIVLVALITVAMIEVTRATTIRESIQSDYAQIEYYLSQMAFDELKAFESKNIQCGFGPGEEGLGCIKQMIDREPSCLNNLLFALRQGCKLDENDGTFNCFAPPCLTQKTLEGGYFLDIHTK